MPELSHVGPLHLLTLPCLGLHTNLELSTAPPCPQTLTNFSATILSVPTATRPTSCSGSALPPSLHTWAHSCRGHELAATAQTLQPLLTSQARLYPLGHGTCPPRNGPASIPAGRARGSAFRHVKRLKPHQVPGLLGTQRENSHTPANGCAPSRALGAGGLLVTHPGSAQTPLL